MNQDIQNQRKHERETEAYKAFSQIAKKVKKIEYDKKWEITPDVTDPLRKFILQRDTPFFKLQVVLYGTEFYHRGDYSDNRYDYKFHIAFKGFYQSSKGADIILSSTLLVKPRVTKKLVKLINETLLPNVYTDIQKHNDFYNLAHDQEKYFQDQLKNLGLHQLSYTKSTDNINIAPYLYNIPAQISLCANKQGVQIDGEIPYDKFNEMATKLGWKK